MRKTFLAAACAALLLVPASIAQGAELLYWDNFGNGSVSFADINGRGGGSLNLSGIALQTPEGMAYDSATGRLFIADSGNEPGGIPKIVAVNVDGTGAAVFDPSGNSTFFPTAIAVDPVGRRLYWANFSDSTINWADLDGNAVGTLNTDGTTVSGPLRMSADPATGRVYWANRISPNRIAFAKLDNTGGGTLSTVGATGVENITGLAVDQAGGRLYLLKRERGVSFANLDGSGGGDLDISGAVIDEPFGIPSGLALDPQAGRLYWGNSEQQASGAFGYAALTGGGGGGLDIATAPADRPADPVILKSPTGMAAPLVTRVGKARASFACSQGTWAPDFAGSFVYRAPSKFAYQWMRNGKPMPGATATTLTATAGGSYTCTVTASNQAGSAAQTSAAVAIAPAQLHLTLKKKVAVKPGRLAKLKLRIANVGDVATKPARLCLKTGKRAKALKALKCKKLGPVLGGAKLAGTLKLKVAAVASGTYRVKLTVKGAPAKAATAKIVVRGSK